MAKIIKGAVKLGELFLKTICSWVLFMLNFCLGKISIY